MPILSADFQNVFNLPDDTQLELYRAAGVEILRFGARVYVYVAGIDDDGIAVFEMLPDGSLTSLPDVEDSGALELDGAFQLTSITIGLSTYLIASGQFDDGISVFSVDPLTGALTNTDNLSDAGALELDGAAGIEVVTVGTRHFAVVAGYNDNGLSVFEIDGTGHLTPVQNIPDAGSLELQGAYFVHSAVVDDTALIFVGGYQDDGISVFSMDGDGILTPVFDLADTPAISIAHASGLATAIVGLTTYLYVAGQADDGISVFSVASDGTLTHVTNVTTASLAGVHDLDIIEVEGVQLLAAASQYASALSLFVIEADGSLTFVDDVFDNGSLELQGTAFGDFVENETGLFYVASGYLDSGLSVFEIGGGDTQLTGDDADNFILGFGGDDTLLGLDGNDTLAGGAGNDLLSGGRGTNVLRGGAGIDTASYDGSRGVIANLAAGTAVAHGYAYDSLDGVENLTGSALRDVLTGDANANLLDGGGGRDNLEGEAGSDILIGGDGADVLNGGAGNDFLEGGNGRDSFIFADGFGQDTVSDLDAGRERLDLRDVAAAASLADLTVSQRGSDVLVEIDGVADSILLLATAAEDVSAGYFWF